VKLLSQQLRRLGVEVFDSASNEKYSWDSLAGYEEIKQQLQETVLNAMQYPDLYDGIGNNDAPTLLT
jgi:SpoVK/Ycf46/Vps4 family AAA+-type ATPase